MSELVVRCLVLILTVAAALALKPLATASMSDVWQTAANVLLGLGLGGLGLALERQIRTRPFRVIAGGVAGLVAGAVVARVLLGAIPPGLVIHGWPVAPDLLRPIVYLLLCCLGAMLGAHKGAAFSAESLTAALRPHGARGINKVLDTSVIIDGRIADIAETGFLDGILIVPQFVLRELQHVADSADPLKKNRGRKGLDVLQRLKKNAKVMVQFPDIEFPALRDVDHKLIELSRQMSAKIITNDMNLNKVAQLRGVEVLNINDLSNSLKPVVLPGETMTVFILKEGSQPYQGVAYLDDGTMVVVDEARKHLGKNVEIIVTSVLQTTAGKMFFGKLRSDVDRAPVRRPHKEPEKKGPAGGLEQGGGGQTGNAAS